MERIGGRAQGQMSQRGCGRLWKKGGDRLVVEMKVREHEGRPRSYRLTSAHPSTPLRAGSFESQLSMNCDLDLVGQFLPAQHQINPRKK